MSGKPIAYVVEDDDSFRRALCRILESSDIITKAFKSAEEFLACGGDLGVGCLILDVRLPGTNGLDLQAILNRRSNHLPIIFLTGHGDIPMSVRAIKNGAVDFLTKPVRSESLVAAVQSAFDVSANNIQALADLGALRARYETLTAREKEVLALIVAGNLNKQAAGELGITERTVKAHRAQIMVKMRVDSICELVLAAHKLGH